MNLTGTETFFIVMNAGSGRNAVEDKQQAIDAAMREAGRHYEITAVPGGELTSAVADVVAKAREAKGVVVACGGDGTLSAVAGQVWESGLPFGILPQGTFNYVGRTFGIPADIPAATRILLGAHIEPVQVGQLNEHVFLVNASVGLYPELLEDREAYKKRYGRSRLVALWSGLVTLLRDHRELTLRLTFEGKERLMRTPTLVVGNNALQLEQIGVDGTPLTQGELVAMMARPVGTLEMYWLLLRGAFSSLGDADQVRTFGFDRLNVRVGERRWERRRVKVAMDGEITHLTTPLTFQVAPKPLQLLVPPDYERIRERA